MSLLLIALVVGCIIFSAVRPITIGGKSYSFGTVSLLGLALMILWGVVDYQTLHDGIIGNGFVEPWKIIVIFFSVAYVSISTDATGIFDYLAYRLVHAANGDGRKLFLFFYLFGAFLTVLTSNDIVILTLTPVIFYVGKHAKVNIMPLLFTEFVVANTASMFLLIGDPTNIILGSALGVTFAEFAASMWLPGLVALVANGLLLWWVFRSELAPHIKIKNGYDYRVRNWVDAHFSIGGLLLMLIVLAISHTVGLQIWIVTSLFAGLFLLNDICFGFYYHKTRTRRSKIQKRKHLALTAQWPEFLDEVHTVIQRIPWRILPFITGMFVFVQVLYREKVVEQIASWLLRFAEIPEAITAAIGTIGFFLSNIINNQPTAILLANVLTHPVLESVTNLQDLVYPAVVATSLGANVTLLGALAGLMWRSILRQKGIEVSYVEFAKTMLKITPFTFVITILALLLVK